MTRPKADLLQGSLCPAVYRTRATWLDQFQVGGTEIGRRAKFYKLAKAGTKQSAAEEKSWDRLALAIAKVRKAV